MVLQRPMSYQVVVNTTGEERRDINRAVNRYRTSAEKRCQRRDAGSGFASNLKTENKYQNVT